MQVLNIITKVRERVGIMLPKIQTYRIKNEETTLSTNQQPCLVCLVTKFKIQEMNSQ